MKKISKEACWQLFFLLASLPGLAITAFSFWILGFVLTFYFSLLIILLSIIAIVVIIINKKGLFEILEKIFEEKTST